MLTAEIRSAYLDFFGARDHKVVPSSSLVPGNDPTLLFTNAGMVQFKDALTGRERLDYTRATSCQRCVRAGGKHNDLENVGHTARHHTLFEMLGNFSFGDYFKEEAIDWAWEFVRDVLGWPRDRLWVTVHPTDDEARRLWLDKIGMPAERVIDHEENFWAMGDTGPCGPNTELFYDQGPAVAGGPPGSPEEDGDRFLEFWNLVFPQFDRSPDGTLEPLASPGIDTGMGLERTAAIAQGVLTNFEADVFRGVMTRAARMAGIRGDADHRRERLAARDRGPHPGRVVPDRGRRAAEQRGPGLRAAPDRAPRTASRAPARPARALLPCAGRAAGGGDGRGLPAPRGAPGQHRGGPAGRGGALCAHARPRHGAPRAHDRRPVGGHDPRRRRLRTLRHLRVPRGPHGGCRARTRPGRGQGRLRCGDGDPARPLARGDAVRRERRAAGAGGLQRAVRGLRVPRQPRQHRGALPHRGWRAGGDGAARGARVRARGPRPDTVLRRGRRPGGRHRRDRRRRRPFRGGGHHARRRPAPAPGPARRRRPRGRAGSHGHRGQRTPRPTSSSTTRRRTCCTRRCATCWARTSSRRAPSWRRTACVSTSRTPHP